jgi:hypothetical protein
MPVPRAQHCQSENSTRSIGLHSSERLAWDVLVLEGEENPCLVDYGFPAMRREMAQLRSMRCFEGWENMQSFVLEYEDTPQRTTSGNESRALVTSSNMANEHQAWPTGMLRRRPLQSSTPTCSSWGQSILLPLLPLSRIGKTSLHSCDMSSKRTKSVHRARQQ